ncbi:hypothetical protein AB2G82_24595 (plasmid) [Escherichia coli]
MFKNIVGGVFPRSEELFSIRSRFSNWKKFLQAYRGNYCDGAYTPPGLMISGTTVIHGLFTDNQHLFWGLRRYTSISNALMTKDIVMSALH